VDGILGHNLLLFQAFSVGIPLWMGFWATTYYCFGPFGGNPFVDGIFRPQLVVVSGLFGGNPLVDGILGHNLLLSLAFFHNLVLFSRWNFGIPEAFFTNLSFIMMEFWLSRSLFHEFFFFHDGILAIKKPFSRTFFFFHDGILAIKKPCSQTFFFFTMEFWLSRSLFHELFSFFTMEFWLSRSLFHKLFSFSRWNFGYQEAFFANFSFFFTM
jgi:hypothetical protein